MKNLLIAAAAVLCASAATARAQGDIAPTGTLRAAYLSTNPAQSTKDPQTGALRGASYDLARELPGGSASRSTSGRSPDRQR